MARSNIPMVINLRQNTNDANAAYGKWFAEVDSKEPLNLKGFAKHMTGHGKIADYQMCVLVLGQVVDCMSELLAQGQPVKLDGLGTFSPSVDGQKLGKDTLAKAVEAGADSMINGIKINFTPENIKGDKLTSRAFKEQCVFELGYVVESEVRWSVARSAACRRRHRSATCWHLQLTATAVAATAVLRRTEAPRTVEPLAAVLSLQHWLRRQSAVRLRLLRPPR